MNESRRDFFRTAAVPTGLSFSAACYPHLAADEVIRDARNKLGFTIGLSQYSLRHMLESGELAPLDFPSFAIDTFGIEQIDISDRAIPPVRDRLPFLEKLRIRSERAGTNIFLMTVEPLRLGFEQAADRNHEIQRVAKSVDQACVAGATYLRVCLDTSDGDLGAQTARVIDGLRRLADHAATKNLTILVEPTTGLSHSGLWLARVLREIDRDHCGSMPSLGRSGKLDSYHGIAALLETARVISAKSHSFADGGLQLQCNYPRLFKMIAEAEFNGIVAIQYEGQQAEIQGVLATQKLLERLREHLVSHQSLS